MNIDQQLIEIEQVSINKKVLLGQITEVMKGSKNMMYTFAI